MPAIRTQKKNDTLTGLAAFGFTKTPKDRDGTHGTASQAHPPSSLCVLADNNMAAAGYHGINAPKPSVPPIAELENAPPSRPSLLKTSKAPAASTPASPLMSPPKRSLLKSVGKGGKEVLYRGNRPDDPTREWDDAHEHELGTGTKKLTFGCSFVLAE
jgi:hypothetical protein